MATRDLFPDAHGCSSPEGRGARKYSHSKCSLLSPRPAAARASLALAACWAAAKAAASSGFMFHPAMAAHSTSYWF